MFRNNCFRSVLQAINRYAYSPQTSHSLSLRSSSHRFLSRISDTNDKSFIDSSDVSPKVWTSNDKREKRLSIFKKSVSELEFDVLGEELIKSTSIAKLFELISLHHSVMNNRHIAETFETLHDLLRDASFDRRQVLMSTEFQHLCARAMNRIRFFNTSELLSCIKSLIFWGVSPQTMLMQSFLQMARQLINDFTIEELIFFDNLLAKMTRNQNYSISFDADNDANADNQTIIPLVDALKLALPLVFQVKIESKEINYDDINLVVSCLRMACERNVKDDIIDKLVAALSLKLDELSIDQCFSIVASLTCLRHKPTVGVNYTDKLIRNCLDKATTIPTNQLPSRLTHQVVSLLFKRRGKRMFYHKGLFDFVPNFILENPQRVPLYRSCLALNGFISFDHIHYGLIDYISEQICVNQEFVNEPKVSFVNVLQYFALPANYHRNKPNSAEIYEAIIESPSVNNCRESKAKHLLFRILKSLCILEYFPQEFISNCVSNYAEDAVIYSTSFGLRRELLADFVTLYQSLSLDNNNFNSKLMADRLKPYIDEYVSILFNEQNPLTDSSSMRVFLSQGLGGQQFVTNGVFSEFGHYIDHLVVMNKDGYPVAISNNNNENICYINDLSLPSDCKKIGIIGLTYRAFCRHPFVLKGETDHRIKTLRKSGIIPVAINLDSFDALIENERIPFLMREIKEVLQQSESQTKILN